VETLVSTRLDPGVDPVVEADRRGAILAIVRLGNKDLQVPGGQVQEGDITRTSYQSPCGGGQSSGAPMPMGTPVGGYSTMPTNFIAGGKRPAIWDADVRHADWLARTAFNSDGRARRFAEARR